MKTFIVAILLTTVLTGCISSHNTEKQYITEVQERYQS